MELGSELHAAPTSIGEHVVVESVSGPVRGRWRAHSAAFLGIPFAEPPFGELRFQAPVARAPWTGVRDALEPAATPQRKALGDVTTIPEPSIPGADILTLNVFTPRPAQGANPLPVLVYLHGGGYIAGSPASPWYDGAAFNRDGVITVTVSYRLGFEGFGWLPDAPANRAVLDWLLALEWVRDNIARFGGDPSRVSIGGQSAGGGAVMTLLTMPRARGLFSAAISMSGAAGDIPLPVAQQTTAGLAERLGIAADRAGFAGVPEMDLIAAQGGGIETLDNPTAEDLISLLRGATLGRQFGPVIDGELHPWTVEEGLAAGAGQDIPLLVGTTRGEFAGLAHGYRQLFADRDGAELLNHFGLAPDAARRFTDALPGHDPAEIVGQYVSDAMFRRPLLEWLDLRRDAASTWVYDFAWRSQVSGVAEHCLDVPFVFDLLADPDVARVAGPHPPQALAELIHGAYVGLVRDGDPGWPAYAHSRSVMVFDTESGVVAGGYTSARALARP